MTGSGDIGCADDGRCAAVGGGGGCQEEWRQPTAMGLQHALISRPKGGLRTALLPDRLRKELARLCTLGRPEGGICGACQPEVSLVSGLRGASDGLGMGRELHWRSCACGGAAWGIAGDRGPSPQVVPQSHGMGICPAPIAVMQVLRRGVHAVVTLA